MGYFFGLVIASGIFDRWETMALPEGLHPSSFVPNDNHVAVYLQTTEGILLKHNMYDDNEVTSWRIATEIITPTGGLQYGPCVSELPYQNWPTISRPRSKVQAQLDCTYYQHFDRTLHYRYVILENGTTRFWRQTPDDWNDVFMVLGYIILFTLIGAIGGGLLLKDWAYGPEKSRR